MMSPKNDGMLKREKEGKSTRDGSARHELS
jgi:hypothetical protein